MTRCSYASLCVTVFYCTFMFLYNIVSGQLALLLLINDHMKSHTRFQLVPKSVTLIDLKWRNDRRRAQSPR